MIMKMKIFSISAELLKNVFQSGTYPERSVLVKNGLPEDAKICDIRFNGFDRCTVELLIESESFDFIPEGCPYPHMGTTIEILRRRSDEK